MSVQSEADKQLKKQDQLEKELLKMVNGFNSVLVKDYIREYSRKGNIINAFDYKDTLHDILLAHYIEVGGYFSKTIDLPQRLELSEEERSELDALLGSYFNVRALEQAEIMSSTTQANFNDSAIFAQEQGQESAVDGNRMSQAELAMLAGAVLSRKLRGRAETISITETQMIAENSKSAEVSMLIGQKPDFTQTTPRISGVKKTWITKGDEKVRRGKFDHVSADEQTVDFNEPYVVSGELLMRPSDESLGASVGNVINCRCKSMAMTSDIAKIRERRLG